MKREKINIERELSSTSANIIWPLLSTPSGLSKWIADEVKNDNGVLTFTWGSRDGHTDSRQAEVVESKKYDHIRYRWLSDDFAGTYWELRLEKGDITDDYILSITDFAPEDDHDLVEEIWDNNLERLHRNTGV